jgi:hypothetical protein
MAYAMQVNLSCRLPMQTAEQGNILKLDVGVELAASDPVRGTHSKPDQLRSQPTNSTICRGDREPRSPPDAGRGFVDADRSHDLRRLGGQCGDGYQRDCRIVDVVMVVVDEDALLFYKYLVPEARYTLKLPGFRRCADQKFRADESRMIHVAHAGILSFS